MTGTWIPALRQNDLACAFFPGYFTVNGRDEQGTPALTATEITTTATATLKKN